MRGEVGMDVHRKRSQVALADDPAWRPARQPQPAQRRCRADRDAGRLEPGTPVAFEAADGWAGWLSCSKELELEPQLVHPSRGKAIAAARLKDDRVDARTLAQLLRAELLPRPGSPPGRP
jgi:transposase